MYHSFYPHIHCMKNINQLYVFLCFVVLTLSCKPHSGQDGPTYHRQNIDQFFQDPYWFGGKGEISTYHLVQDRYGEKREGRVILIQVTEDFLVEEQVKNDLYQSQNSTSVLKSNLLKDFTTGIYDYSIMTSTFTPVDKREYPYTLKVSFSSQDWCGQTFQQLNLIGKRYGSTIFSYFETIGDKKEYTDAVFLEDELFNVLRINPDFLPVNEFNIIPSLEFTRLNNIAFNSYRGHGILETADADISNESSYSEYQLHYPDLDRKLVIRFETTKPYKIISWKEEFFNRSTGKQSSLHAKIDTSIHTDYWKKNMVKDTLWREQLNL